ncbi:hypothetical protein LCGC14_2506080 [marine sediment metagenome]|uniref:Uncharacterized protein n=1 Tax=marine sediment metagenome TaxID=412755 RepID=A0A0F9B0G0_9ZZZZ
MGKFFPSPSRTQAPAAPQVLSKTAKVKEGDDSARRTRLAEKRRQGRRASVLSNISEEEAQLTNVSRPGADTLAKTFGS